MADEEERRLERDAAAGDPAAAVRLAVLLERAGRRAEAARLLRPLVAHPEVRARLATYPAWDHVLADAGQTSHADVEPVVSTPRVLWSRPVPHALQGEAPPLLASPFGVVCLAANGFEVLDPDTGAPRFQANEGALSLASMRRTEANGVAVAGDLLVVVEVGGVRRYDLVSGEDLGLLGFGGMFPSAFLAGSVHVNVNPDGLFARAVGRRDTGQVVWSAEAGVADAMNARVAVGGDLVFVLGGDGLHDCEGVRAFERATGRPLWVERPAPAAQPWTLAADRRGVVLSLHALDRKDTDSCRILDAEGRRLAEHAPGWLVAGLAPDFAVGRAHPGPRVGGASWPGLVRIPRSGPPAEAAPLPVQALGGPVSVAIARDVILGAEGTAAGRRLVACRASGERLWDHELGDPTVIGVALLDRTVFVLTRDDVLVALTDL